MNGLPERFLSEPSVTVLGWACPWFMDGWWVDWGMAGLGFLCLGWLSSAPCVISSSRRISWACSNHGSRDERERHRERMEA